MSKKKQSIISSILIFLFISIFSYFFGGEYIDFYKTNQNTIKQNNLINGKIDDFSLDKIRELNSVIFKINPDKRLLDSIVSKINSAKDRVHLEVYIFTENRIREAIKKAKNRGLDVKVLLERNPYMAPKLNNKAFYDLEKAGVNVTWSNSNNYSLNHSKFMIVDDEIIISTGNYSYSTFIYNRDFFLFIKDNLFLKDVLDIFKNDFNGKKVSSYNHNLVLSPNYSRNKFEKLISSAEKDLKIYFPYLKDKDLEQLLYKKIKDGVDISIVMSSDILKKEEGKKMIEKMMKNGIKIKTINKPKIHSKSILTDSKYLYIGSINFSNYSIDKNRELGVILKNKKVINNFITIFNNDFSKL